MSRASEKSFLALFLVAAALALLSAVAQAGVGMTQIAGTEGDGPVTVFYPSSGEEKVVKRGPFTFNLAEDGVPVRGNGRLVMVSHGSGGWALGHADLARALVHAGFVVATLEHQGDNYKDMSAVGPKSWKRRPQEISRAIDAVAQDARFAPLLKLDKVGMYACRRAGIRRSAWPVGAGRPRA
jgi:predicted dienelactone hydrolase